MSGIVHFEFMLPFEIIKRGKLFVSFCPLLDVYSQGNSKPEAKTNLTEALKLFIESCYQRGTLEQVLRESGFKTIEHEKSLPKGQEYVKVPLSLIAARKNAEARAH